MGVEQDTSSVFPSAEKDEEQIFDLLAEPEYHQNQFQPQIFFFFLQKVQNVFLRTKMHHFTTSTFGVRKL